MKEIFAIGLSVAATVGCVWFGLHWVISDANARIKAHDKRVSQFLADHNCKRDYYTDRGVIVYKCDNGAWTEWDVWAETGAK